MKVCYQNIVASPATMFKDFGLKKTPPEVDRSAEKVLSVMKRVARDDTKLEWRDLDQSTWLVNYSYLEMVNAVKLVDCVIKAEKDGYDAVIVGCGNDPGLRECRQAVDIPVVGPTEAASMLACILGYRYGLVTVMGMTNVCEDNVRKQGLSWRAVMPVQNYVVGGEGEELFDNLEKMLITPEVINPQFEGLCKTLIKDGAEVIVPACTRLGPATVLAGYTQVPGTGVPIIDVTQAAVKFAEMLVDLKRTAGLGKSQAKVFQSTPMRDYLRSLVKL